jgi:hypothetical protein
LLAAVARALQDATPLVVTVPGDMALQVTVSPLLPPSP